MNFLDLKHTQQGMTLLEILVAITLGTFLLAGVLQIFTSSKQSYRMQENMSRMQENGRFAMEFMGQDLREADYRACDTVASVGGSVAGIDNAAIAPFIAGTDTITVTQLPLSPSVAPPASVACVAANAGSCVPDACSTACAAGFPAVPANPPNPAIPAILPLCPLAASSVAYSIQADASGQPALFKSTNGAAAQALIEGISNMQILYGEDTSAIVAGTPRLPNYYVPSNLVVSMNNVVSLRVTLTARTIDAGLTTTGDGRLTQTYSTTISLRNRNRIQ